MEENKQTHLSRIREAKQKRLNELEVQKARFGINCPPEINTEIEDIKSAIAQLDYEIQKENLSLLRSSSFERVKVLFINTRNDRDLANVIAQTVSRITLTQIDIVFLHDSSHSAGITHISALFERVKTNLNHIKTLIILLTPSSVIDQTMYFESGIVASNKNCKIIPICIGIDGSSEVPFPLSLYQSYQLSDYTSFKSFIENLLSNEDINFDEEMAEPVLRKAITKFVEITAARKEQSLKPSQYANLAEDIKKHIDRRFLELVDKQDYTRLTPKQLKVKVPRTYTVPIYLDFPNLKSKQFLEINPSDTVQDIYDNIYFMLDHQVPAFTYLETWILRERRTNIQLIIREVSEMIPARFVFTPKTQWEAIKLEKPYSPLSSNKNIDAWLEFSNLEDDD